MIQSCIRKQSGSDPLYPVAETEQRDFKLLTGKTFWNRNQKPGIGATLRVISEKNIADSFKFQNRSMTRVLFVQPHILIMIQYFNFSPSAQNDSTHST